ncbi:DHA2 family efflux MFS transporter permease subunit [Deferribacter abyssi]|uniref:DHA2 family efflux MFS transporter permease subunit n=1 Tax=Deferribacter abyssi TaxID=213806 RepID=UPI003C25A8ED
MTTKQLPLYERIDNVSRAIITFIVMTGTFMAILDTTIVDVVVPKMMSPLKTDLYGVQWVITSYMTAAATGLLLIESLTKVLGLRNLFLIGITIFTISSAACGVASDLAQMIISRSFQGLGEAFIVATAQTIMFSIFPPEKKGIAMGIFGMGVSFAPALGPTAGGYLTEHFSWRYVFYVNLPVGLMVIILGLFMLPKVLEKREKLHFNFVSYTFFAIFTIPLLILLSKGQQKGWFQSPFIVKLLFISVFGLLLFAISEILSKKRLIDYSIFKIKEYSVAILIYAFTLGLSIYQIFYLIPLYYENLKGYTTLQTGLHMLAFAIFIGFTSFFAGAFSDKYGEKNILLINAILYFITSVILIPKLNYYTPSIKTILLTIPLGFSLGTFFAPISTLAMRKLGAKTQMGVSFLHYIRFMGGSFGTAIATNTLQSKISFHYDEISAIQNYSYISNYLYNAKTYLSQIMLEQTAELKSYALFGKVQYLMSASHAFQDTFRHAGYFGIFGLFFLVFLFMPSKNKN